MTTVRTINAACNEASNGWRGYVFANPTSPSDMCFPDYQIRIIKARRRNQHLEGLVLASGMWIPIVDCQ